MRGSWPLTTLRMGRLSSCSYASIMNAMPGMPCSRAHTGIGVRHLDADMDYYAQAFTVNTIPECCFQPELHKLAYHQYELLLAMHVAAACLTSRAWQCFLWLTSSPAAAAACAAATFSPPTGAPAAAAAAAPGAEALPPAAAAAAVSPARTSLLAGLLPCAATH